MTSFSERYGYKENSVIKNGFSSSARNLLWNFLYKFLITKELLHIHHDEFDNDDFDVINRIHNEIPKVIWEYFFKNRIDEFISNSHLHEYLKKYFFDGRTEWWQILDLFEFIAQYCSNYYIVEDEVSYKTYGLFFIRLCNYLFEKNNFAYRFINEQIAELNTTEEIEEIKTAINSPMEEIKIHISQALNHYSNLGNPDYRNSIKESISAVECLCRKITGKNTLGKALNQLRNKGVDLDTQLKEGIEKIYSFTNGEEGIRHALMKEVAVESEDARFMLVLCSSFVNYLVEKADKAGIKY